MFSRMAAGGIGGYMVSIMAGALFVGGPAAYVSHNFGYGKAAQAHTKERWMWSSREIALWHELGAARVANIDLIESIDTMWEVSGQARRDMQRRLANQRKRLEEEKQKAADALERLNYVESTWKDVALPDALVEPFCLHDDDADCDPAPAATGLQDGVEVREPATGDGQPTDGQ